MSIWYLDSMSYLLNKQVIFPIMNDIINGWIFSQNMPTKLNQQENYQARSWIQENLFWLGKKRTHCWMFWLLEIKKKKKAFPN